MRCKSIINIILISYIVLGASTLHAVTLSDQFKRIHDRVAGIHPDASILSQMQSACLAADTSVVVSDSTTWSSDCYKAAASIAIEHPRFYNVTLKNMVTPWTNEAQSKFAELNDYTATVIGMVRDETPFWRILTDDILYTVNGVTPAYSRTNNNHYANAEAQDVDLKANLVPTTQSSISTLNIPIPATAGVMTTRAGAKAFYIDGTNRAMFRFTLLNHLCNDLEFYKDVTSPADRIKRDVSRSPGGDSRIYLNNCIGCHAGMDGMIGAFAYYNYEYDPDSDPNAENGELVYREDFLPETVGGQPHKYKINMDNFKWGFDTVDASWVNYWREGPNVNIGWDSLLPGSGVGAKALGEELAKTNDFATCQVKKVFETVCLRSPVDQTDRNQIAAITASFSSDYSTGYNLKQVFADTAAYCVIPTP